MIASGGFLGLAAVGIVTEIWLPVVGSVVFSIGLSPAVTLATDLIIGAVPPERAGMASGLSEAGSELGGALGLAVIGSAAAAVYRLIIGRTLLTGITDRELEEAQQSLGSAIAVADRLSDATGPALVSAAQVAFSSAAAVSFALRGMSTLIIALATKKRLRRTPKSNAGAASETGHRRSSR